MANNHSETERRLWAAADEVNRAIAKRVLGKDYPDDCQ